MDKKNKKRIVKGIATGLMVSMPFYFIHEAKVLEAAEKYNMRNIYSMDIGTWKEACSHYELCNKQLHIESEAVSGTLISTIAIV